jgi:hypothetical protein
MRTMLHIHTETQSVTRFVVAISKKKKKILFVYLEYLYTEINS